MPSPVVATSTSHTQVSLPGRPSPLLVEVDGVRHVAPTYWGYRSGTFSTVKQCHSCGTLALYEDAFKKICMWCGHTGHATLSGKWVLGPPEPNLNWRWWKPWLPRFVCTGRWIIASQSASS